MLTNQRDRHLVKGEALARQWHFKVISSVIPPFNLVFTPPSLAFLLRLSSCHLSIPQSHSWCLYYWHRWDESGLRNRRRAEAERVSITVTFLKRLPDWQVTLTPCRTQILHRVSCKSASLWSISKSWMNRGKTAGCICIAEKLWITIRFTFTIRFRYLARRLGTFQAFSRLAHADWFAACKYEREIMLPVWGYKK